MVTLKLINFYQSHFLGLKKYMEIAQNSEINKQPFEILNRIGYLKVLWIFTINVWQIPYIWFLSTEMTKKWSFLNEEPYMQKAFVSRPL